MATRRQSIPGTYRELLLDARRRGYGINEAGRRRLVRAFEHAMRELEEKSRSENPLTRDRAQSMRRQLRELLDALSNESVKIITRTRDLTIEEILELHKRQALKLARAHGGPVRRIEARFDRLAVRAVGTLASRRQNAGVFKTLIKHDRIGAVRDLDRLIDAAVATGKSPARLTKDIAALLANDPSVKLGEYGLTKQRTAHLRTLYSDSRRIAVTEVNNALREANTQALKASGIIIGATWGLSGRHHVEDECCPGDTNILTSDGWRPIADVLPGDLVMTHRGRLRPVVATIRRRAGSQGMQVAGLRGETNHTWRLIATPNHPVLTDRGWCPVGDLRRGTLVRCVLELPPVPDDLRDRGTECIARPHSARNAPTPHGESTGAGRCDAHRDRHPLLRSSRIELEDSPSPSERRPFVEHTWDRIGHASSLDSSFPVACGQALPASPAACASESRETTETGTRASKTAPSASPSASRTARTPEEVSASSRIGTLDCRLAIPEHGEPLSEGSACRSAHTASPGGERASLAQNTCESRSAALQVSPDSGGVRHPGLFSSWGAEPRRFRMHLAYVEYSILTTERPEVFNLQVHEDESFVADGVVVHNCDDLANYTGWNGEKGAWPIDDFPAAPHPWCSCQQVGPVYYRDPEEWA